VKFHQNIRNFAFSLGTEKAVRLAPGRPGRRLAPCAVRMHAAVPARSPAQPFTWGPTPLRFPLLRAPTRGQHLDMRSLHSHAHARGPSNYSRRLRKVGPLGTCATTDLLLQHLDKIFTTYVRNTRKIRV